MDPTQDHTNFKMNINDFQAKYKIHIGSLKSYLEVLNERGMLDENYGMQVSRLSQKLDAIAKSASNRYISDHIKLMSRTFSLNSEYNMKMSESIKSDMLMSYKQQIDKSIIGERQHISILENSYHQFDKERRNFENVKDDLFKKINEIESYSINALNSSKYNQDVQRRNEILTKLKRQSDMYNVVAKELKTTVSKSKYDQNMLYTNDVMNINDSIMKYFVYQTSAMKNMEYDTNEVIRTVENYIVDNEKLDGSEKNMEEREKVKELRNDYLISSLTKIKVRETDVKEILNYMYATKTKSLNNQQDLIKINNIFSSIQKQLSKDIDFGEFTLSSSNLKQMRGDTDETVTDFNELIHNQSRSTNNFDNSRTYKESSQKNLPPKSNKMFSDSTGNSYNMQNQNSFGPNNHYPNRSRSNLLFDDYKGSSFSEENSVFSRKDSKNNTRKASLYNQSNQNTISKIDSQNFKKKEPSEQHIDNTHIIYHIQKILSNLNLSKDENFDMQVRKFIYSKDTNFDAYYDFFLSIESKTMGLKLREDNFIKQVDISISLIDAAVNQKHWKTIVKAIVVLQSIESETVKYEDLQNNKSDNIFDNIMSVFISKTPSQSPRGPEDSNYKPNSPTKRGYKFSQVGCYLKDLECLKSKNFWYETLNYVVVNIYNDPKKNDIRKIKILISVNYEMMCYCLNDTNKLMSIAKDLLNISNMSLSCFNTDINQLETFIQENDIKYNSHKIDSRKDDNQFYNIFMIPEALKDMNKR